MSVRNDCEDAFSRAIRAANHELLSSRRSLLLAPLLAARAPASSIRRRR